MRTAKDGETLDEELVCKPCRCGEHHDCFGFPVWEKGGKTDTRRCQCLVCRVPKER